MRLRTAAVALLCTPLAGIVAQSPVPLGDRPEMARAALFLEVLGPGGFYSLNVERITPGERLYRFGVTAGGVTNYDNITNGANAIIGTIGRIYRVSLPGGQPDSPVEVGGGVVLGTQSRHQSGMNRDEGSYAALVGQLGVRTRRTGSGFMWRFTFTPLLNFSAHNDFTRTGLQPHFGGSVGWMF